MNKKEKIKIIQTKTEQIRERVQDADEFDHYYQRMVLYTGSLNAKVMLIGRDLGRDEVIKKEPFIGRAGDFLRGTVKGIGFDFHKDFYTCNLVPYKPDQNRSFPNEIVEKFGPVLKAQIMTVQPEVIVTLGGEAFQWMQLAAGLNRGFGFMKQLRNIYSTKKFLYIRNIREFEINCRFYPILHPSYLMRQGSLEDNEDFEKLFFNPLQDIYNYLNSKEDICTPSPNNSNLMPLIS